MDNTVYVVKPGDSLWSISQKFGTDTAALALLNGISENDTIYPDQILRIPQPGSCGSIRIHIVQPGDTLYDLAKQYDTTVGELASLNGLEDPDKLDIDQILRIPSEEDDCPPLRSYTVRRGDTLFKISQKTGIPLAQLINLNRLSVPDSIYPGQVLLLSDN